MDTITGNVWKLGNHIDTDAIVPGRYLDADMEEIRKHVFESMLPEFSAHVMPGDVIIAGTNFGCGSSRENAAIALKTMGIGCIVAESFGRIFFRNAIAIGLPLLNAPGIVSEFEAGDRIGIRLAEGEIHHMDQGRSMRAQPLSSKMLAILEKGGILELLKEERRHTRPMAGQ